MTCRYTYQGKTYEAHEFDDVLRAMAPSEAAAFMPSVKAVPVAPFVGKTDAWVALALKRVIKMAADGGYDRVAFVTGQQSADRYNLSKQVSKVQLVDNASGGIGQADLEGDFVMGTLHAYDLNGRRVIDRHVRSPEELADFIGKDVAARLLESKPFHGRSGGGGGGVGVRQRELAGPDLKVGGHGMIAFYDELLPRIARNVVRKLGGAGMRRVRLPNMQASAGQEDGAGNLRRSAALRELAGMPLEAGQLGFDINEAMRVSAAHGMPLFSLAQVTAGLPSWPETDESEAQVQSEAARAEAR